MRLRSQWVKVQARAGVIAAIAISLLAGVWLWHTARSEAADAKQRQLEWAAQRLQERWIDRLGDYERSLKAIGDLCRSSATAPASCTEVPSRLQPAFPDGLQRVVYLEADQHGRPLAASDFARGRRGDAGSGEFTSSAAFRDAVRSARASRRMAVRRLVANPHRGRDKGKQTDTALVLALPVFVESPSSARAPSRASAVHFWLAGLVLPGQIIGLENTAQVAYALYEGSERRPDALILDGGFGGTRGEPEGKAEFERAPSFEAAGRVWSLACALAGDLNSYGELPRRMIAGSFATMLLLCAIVIVADRQRTRSAQQARHWRSEFEQSQTLSAAEQDRTRQALRQSEKRYAMASQVAQDGLWDWDLERNQVEFSPRWKTLLGFAEYEIGNRPEEWLDRLHPEDKDRFTEKLSDHLERRSPRFEAENRIRHRDGSYRWMLTRGLAERDEHGRARRITGAQTDVTARRQAEKRVLHAALHDPLTGLPNRSYFMERLARASRAAARDPRHLFALMFLDVDRFKVVNDSLGHLVGDELLVSIGRRLKTCLRPCDTIARLGGDEFAILLDHLREDTEATTIADRIQKELARPFKVGEQEVYTAVSIGITFSSAGHGRAEDLLRNADTAMYRAKAYGKARYELFDHDMQVHSVERLHLERDLRRGLERGEFLIHYQPIVSFHNGQITGCEALIRWQHPKRGLVGPNEFIPVAEETGLIIPISEWLLETACTQVKEWERLGLPLLQLSVNISPRQFRQQDVAAVVSQALEKTGLDPTLMQLELTETALMEHAETTIRPLLELYGKGVQISLDDFGTGYSSLTYLRRFPIGILKISESFIGQIPSNPGDAAIASGLIALAHGLDLTVIVEGVETMEQLAFLQSKNCDAVQGHVISPPLSTEEFSRLLGQWRGLSVLA